MSKQPLARDLDPVKERESIEKQLYPKRRWRRIISMGLVVPLIIFAFELLLAFFLYLLQNKLIYFVLLNLLLVMQAILGFILAGLSLWFIPSPSWNVFLSGITGRSYEPRSTSHALQVGAGFLLSALLFLLLAEITRVLI